MPEVAWPSSSEVHAAVAQRIRGLLDEHGGLIADFGRRTMSVGHGVLSDDPHSFTAVGAHIVLVTVTDDDGGSATAVVRVVVFAPAEAFALQPDQAEIGARGTEVAVVAIQQQEARTTQGKTVGNRCPDRARSYNDDIRPHEVLPWRR